MRCVAEEDAARAFVEGLTDLADFTNGEPSRDYFRRIAVGQVQNSILPACGCEMAYGVALAMRCAVLRKGCVLCACAELGNSGTRCSSTEVGSGSTEMGYGAVIARQRA
eukprot:2227764-Rhodomonas_salina.2